MARADRLTVEVVLGSAAPVAVTVEVPAGATLGDAVRASGLSARYPGPAGAALPLGIWGRACPAETVLQAGDRAEIYVPLGVDPKEARRRRARPDAVQKPPVDGSVGSR